ncbi:PD-(D/E)XK nuclease-like domain-containing protein [Microbacterium sp. 22195]|uniref:PD-(D/E)XK nuclease-like domain-containing protein n=1 Tax=Microbacterium sp. 22195 TaxID=3453891 RepID=UPI003F85E640
MTIYTDMPERTYHSRSELSSTGARLILDSPARFKYWQEHPQPPKAVFDLGSAAHAKILGVGASIITYPPEHLTPTGNISTKATTVEWEQEQRAKGLIPITEKDAHRVDRMAEAVLADADARQILERIQGREVSIIQDVQGVPCRARFDLYDGIDAGDLKSTRDASPRGFNRSVGSYGYHIQSAWYSDVHYAETGDQLRSFKFVVVEAAPPHLVAVYELDPMWMDVAAGKAFNARETYRKCVETNTWPGYGAATLTAPTWVVFEGDEEEIKI